MLDGRLTWQVQPREIASVHQGLDFDGVVGIATKTCQISCSQISAEGLQVLARSPAAKESPLPSIYVTILVTGILELAHT